MYHIKEVYLTLQGEGAQTGRAAVFCRFAGCNLWSGQESDRTTAVCTFCDTDFVGTDGPRGGRFETPDALAAHLRSFWPSASTTRGKPYVVCTGGEPLLQIDAPLIASIHAQDFEMAIETNGTKLAPPGIDWICVSPKANSELVLTHGHELKLVYPQTDAPPERFAHLNFEHFFLQPMDGPQREANTRLTLEYCLKNPQWRLSLQTHKLLNIP